MTLCFISDQTVLSLIRKMITGHRLVSALVFYLSLWSASSVAESNFPVRAEKIQQSEVSRHEQVLPAAQVAAPFTAAAEAVRAVAWGSSGLLQRVRGLGQLERPRQEKENDPFEKVRVCLCASFS